MTIPRRERPSERSRPRRRRGDVVRAYRSFMATIPREPRERYSHGLRETARGEHQPAIPRRWPAIPTMWTTVQRSGREDRSKCALDELAERRRDRRDESRSGRFAAWERTRSHSPSRSFMPCEPITRRSPRVIARSSTHFGISPSLGRATSVDLGGCKGSLNTSRLTF